MKKESDIYSLDDIPGIGPIGKERLINEGVLTKRHMLVLGHIEIAEITGMDRDKAALSVSFCRQVVQKEEKLQKTEMTAAELLEYRKNIEWLTTGSKALDELLDGGIECGSMTEFAGKYRSGKTQLGHTLAVRVQLDKLAGGLSQDSKRKATCLYMDTENTFRPERIVSIAKFYKMDVDSVLQNIIVQKPKDSAHQMLMIRTLPHLMKELNVRLIILDSGTDLFRAEYIGRGNLARRQQLMNKMIHELKTIGEIHKAGVVFMNQVYGSPDEYGPRESAVGGNIVGHGMTYRISLTKKSKVWVARNEDSPMHAIEDAEFMVTEGGITDVKTKKK